MDFAYAIQALSNGQAAKRSTWGGYVKKDVTSAEDATTETYTLTFVTRSGSQFVYTFDGTSWTPPSGGMTFDAELLEAMCADDWQTGKASAFEAARSGSGLW